MFIYIHVSYIYTTRSEIVLLYALYYYNMYIIIFILDLAM